MIIRQNTMGSYRQMNEHTDTETALVSAMGCNLTIVTMGITGRKTIGKRTEPREAFYLQRNVHLSTW